jgi:pyridoxine 5-phosphate synthase
MFKLGVNIDHVATLRQARGGLSPDPVAAAAVAEAAGADSIVAHLREDRRHINDRDVENLRQSVRTRFNLEMSVADDIVAKACSVRPDQATLVPERRQELTTEGGLNVRKNFHKLRKVVAELQKHKIVVSLFIDPDKEQIEASRDLGVGMIELHTGRYANARGGLERRMHLKEIAAGISAAKKLGLAVNAGHGLDYQNITSIAGLDGIEEFNIGHSIICRSIFVGLDRATKEMIGLLRRARA